MSKVELKGSLASRIGAGALGFILVFSPIVGPVAMAESKTAIVELKEAGFKLAVTVEDGRVKPGANKYQLPRVRVADGNSLQYFIKSVE